MRKNWKNPFITSFLLVAAICCVVSSVAYGYIMHMSQEEFQKKKAQEKVQMIANDLDSHLETFEKMALRVMIGRVYQPSFFDGIPYHEQVLMDDFEQYSNHSVLADECFLYYGNEKLYFTSGYLKYLFTYVDHWPEADQTKFREVLEDLQATPMIAVGEANVLSVNNSVYFMIPLRVNAQRGSDTAVLCLRVKNTTFAERFKVVSGDTNGKFCLYKGDLLICSNLQESIPLGGMVTANTLDEEFTVHYYYASNKEVQSSAFPIQVLLIALDFILIFLVAYVIAEKNYKPVRDMKEKYVERTGLLKNTQSNNALTEISNVLEALLQDNERVHVQIEQSKEMLKDQIIKMLLDGTSTKEMQIYMQELHMKLLGPCYYVVSISFEGEESISEALLAEIRNELEMLSNESDDEYLYALYDGRRNTINIVCSVGAEENRDRMIEDIRQVLKNYVVNPVIGAGGVQRTMSRLSASWLESMEQLHKNLKAKGNTKTNEVVFDSSMLKRMLTALDSDNEKAAVDYLDQYIAQAKKLNVSVITHKIFFANFVSEINKYSSKSGVEVTSSDLSSLLTATNIEDFETAAKETILNLNAQLKLQRNAARDNEAHTVCQYIREHFSEYDMSLELVAQNLNVSDKVVRAAVQEQTGMMYKDFLICLRMDYAKELLEKEIMTVNDVCLKVGYSNVPYFIKVFKKTTGVTPAQYRAQYGKEIGAN